jgi:hypothetical protein
MVKSRAWTGIVRRIPVFGLTTEEVRAIAGQGAGRVAEMKMEIRSIEAWH